MDDLSGVRLSCRACGAAFPGSGVRWRCDCGGLLDLNVAAAFPRERIERRPPGMWRYREALPVREEAIVSFGEGFTPLVEMEAGGRTVLFKQDHLFPSGSYKDRGASVLVSHVRSLGVSSVVEDSSGNAGSAIAAYCARAGIACEIYVPANTSSGKLAQIRSYGAAVHAVPGSREDTAAAVMAAARSTYYASHSWNPFFFHGTKTFAFEVCEQLGWRAPDALVLPVGNGTLLLGSSIGFAELLAAGVVDRVPRLIGVQSERCAPLALAFRAGSRIAAEVSPEPTMAEGIAVAAPVRGEQILAAVRDSGGELVTVDDAAVKRAALLAARQGFCIEPTSAAVVAAMGEATRSLPRSAVVVSVFSGHGLKAPEKLP